MTDEIQKYENQSPELWDSTKNVPKLAWNEMPVRSTRLEMLEILTPMFDLFPKYELSDLAINQYLRLLCDIPPDKLRICVDRAVEDAEFLPTIGTIRKYYAAMTEKNQPKAFVDGYYKRERPSSLTVRDPNETRMQRLAQLKRYGKKDA